MTEEKPYNKFIRKPSNSNLLLNVSLITAFVLLIVSQFVLSKTMTKNQLSASSATAASSAAGTSSNITLVASSDVQLVACSDDDLCDAVALVKPAIVNIDVVSSDVGSSPAQRQSPFSFNMPPSQSLKTDDETLGSGIIVDSRGYILTCYHLVRSYKKVYVTVFSSQRTRYEAEVIAFDQAVDLAILKINADVILPVARLGNSDLAKVTETVLTVGSPFGFQHTVTEGILSDPKRTLTIDGKTYEGLFVTDAAMNRGNAGGALIDSAGLVIGVNTAIVSPSGTFSGIGISIPINKARNLIFKSVEP